MGRVPSNSRDKREARVMVIGKRMRPDKYISSPGRTPRVFTVPSVLESFTPKLPPHSVATLESRFSIPIASSHCKSLVKVDSLIFI